MVLSIDESSILSLVKKGVRAITKAILNKHLLIMKDKTSVPTKQIFRAMKKSTNPVTRWVYRDILIKRFERGDL